MKTLLLAFSLLVFLAGCTSQPVHDPLRPPPPDLPYRTWQIGLLAPNYMEVWVESVDVLDQRGIGYYRVHGGVSSIQNPPDNRGDPRGWPARPGVGATRPMTGIDLPEMVFVRWQSLAEPQTYRVRIDIPEWVRQELVTPHSAFCRLDGQYHTLYRRTVTVGLAPGGIAKAWLTGACLEPIAIGRFVGTIHPEGPYEGTSGGLYYRPPSEHAQRYLNTHEIPFDSW
ncbi:DUF2931 family protein [Halopseudomonas bauzanensis]|uniref:DUF2931 family protein n=1 Tax=Halopseudomonas bauzanensis TaxID=653930 RepID=UPI0025570271|nr:DUF2931 family protein [Halopseudomonas bauzanensis]